MSDESSEPVEDQQGLAPRPVRARVGPLATVALLGAVATLLLVLLGWNVWAMHKAYWDLDERRMRLQREIGRAAYLDEALTLAANMAVLTGERSWVRRHDELDRELRRDNLDISRLAPQLGVREELDEVRRAHDSLVVLERRAIGLAVAGRAAEGSALLTSRAYAEHKGRYVRLMGAVAEALNAQARSLEASYRGRIVTVLVLFVLSGVVLLVGFLLALRNVRGHLERERRDRVDELHDRARLEARVRERTAMLESTSEQLRHAQKMEAIGQLAGGVAHDFNNLLTVIQGHAELLIDELDPTHPGRADVDQIRRASERAAALTSQLLAFGRRQLLKPEVVSLNDIVQSTDRMLRRVLGAHIELVTVLDPELPPCRVDPNQLVQVLVNLLVNARDAITRAGGTITIETRRVEGDQKGALRCALIVRDTGGGMSREVMAHVFEPFFTTKEVGKGTGLGLATVYGIVEQSGGEISVESEEGAGATFIVQFPACDPVDVTADHAVPGQGTDTADRVILLVEDEVAVRNLLGRTLVNHGYQVLMAQNGEEGRRVFAAHRDEIDVVVTDMVMPLLSGLEMVRQLRHERPDLPVLIMSGYAASVQEPGDAGPHTQFLGKPFVPFELVQALRKLLAASPPHDATRDSR